MDNQDQKSHGANLLHESQFPDGIIKPPMLAASTSMAAGDLYYVNSSGIFQKLPVGTVSQVLTVIGGVPSWSTPAAVPTVPVDGWTSVSAAWTYASASTITVPSGAASLYQKGDRIKFTQTTVKYFVVVAVADTLLTVAVNTDYTVANAAISAISYSHQVSPIGYPGWFNYAVTFGGFSVDPSGGSKGFQIIGNTCFITVYGMSNGTSNATTTTVTVPVAPTTAQEFGGTVQVNDSGVFKSGYIQIATSTTLSLYTAFFQTAWTNSGNKNFYIPPSTCYQF